MTRMTLGVPATMAVGIADGHPHHHRSFPKPMSCRHTMLNDVHNTHARINDSQLASSERSNSNELDSQISYPRRHIRSHPEADHTH